MVNAGFAYDLAGMTAYTQVPLFLLQSQGTLIVNQRTELIKNALEEDVTHLLFIDTDMRFPMATLERLLAHDKDIVAVNYPTRKFPIQPVAFANDQTNDRVFTEKDSTGLESVASVGMGIMLIKASIFDKIKLPYFMIGFSAAHQEYTGEDIFFCRKVRAAGYEVFIDHDLSKEVKHTGAIDFEHEHIWATREV
jgi:GT2 family glycosyltransferase